MSVSAWREHVDRSLSGGNSYLRGLTPVTEEARREIPSEWTLEATDTVVDFPPILSVSGRIPVLRGLTPVTEEARRESLRVDTRGNGYGWTGFPLTSPATAPAEERDSGRVILLTDKETGRGRDSDKRKRLLGIGPPKTSWITSWPVVG